MANFAFVQEVYCNKLFSRLPTQQRVSNLYHVMVSVHPHVKT
ncbi:hypothetical protein [Nostoc sp.]